MRKQFLLLLMLLSACKDGPSDPGGDDGPIFTLHQLPVLGSGSVPERYTAEIAVRDGFAYTSTWHSRAPNPVSGNAVKVWNISGNTPVLVDSIIISGANTTSDVQISADGRWLVVSTEAGPSTQNGIAIYDLSVSKTAPTLAKRYSSDATGPGVHTVKLSTINGRLYAFMSINPFGAIHAKLVIADITTPVATTEVFQQDMGNPFVHDVFVRAGILMTAEWTDGIRIWDVGGGSRGGSPSSPVEIGHLQTVGGHAHNIWWYHNPNGEKKYAFVGEENSAELFTMSSGDIHVVDVSNLASPREVAFFSAAAATTSTGRPAGTHNFSMDEASSILYAAYYNGGVRALDVSGDLSACSASEKAPDGRCDLSLMKREVGRALNETTRPTFIWGVQYANSRVFASDMINGIHVIDASALKK